MRSSSFISFAGFVMLIVGTYCPLLRPLPLIKWDMFDCNKQYGIVVLLVAVVGIIGVVLMQIKIARFAAWLTIMLVIAFYFLVLLKIHTSFSFIPFHSISGFLSKQVKFKWGWIPLCGGPVLALLGTLFNKTSNSGGNNFKR